MTPHEVLIAARALIADPDNWCKYSLNDNFGRRCAAGAVIAACPRDTKNRESARAALIDQAAKHYDGFWEISRFNDDDETTHADVMAWFDRAIAATAPKGGGS